MTKGIFKLFSAAILFLLVSNIVEASSSPGVVEGKLRIFLSKGTQLADDTSPSKEKIPYADYPVLILSKDRKTEVVQVTPDAEGRFRASLPAGDYVLDVKRHGRNRLRVTARPFTVVAGQTVQADLEIESTIEPM